MDKQPEIVQLIEPIEEKEEEEGTRAFLSSLPILSHHYIFLGLDLPTKTIYVHVHLSTNYRFGYFSIE